MEEFKIELKALLEKHNAIITLEQQEDDSFLFLNLEVGGTKEIIDSGYRDLIIAPYKL